MNAVEVPCSFQTVCHECGRLIKLADTVVYLKNGSTLLYYHPECVRDLGIAFKPLWNEVRLPVSAFWKGARYEILKGKTVRFAVFKDSCLWIGSAYTLENAKIQAQCEMVCPRYGDDSRLREQIQEGLAPKELVMAIKALDTTGKKSKKASAKPDKEPRPLISATSEELDAAVAGKLRKRETVGSRNQDSLSSKSKLGRPSGRPLGATTGLPIGLCFCYIFQKNERLKSSEKLTDEDITKWFGKEFPGRKTEAFNHISSWRAKYNNGGFTNGVKPKVQSSRYDETGKIIEGKVRGSKKLKEKKGHGIKTVTKDSESFKKRQREIGRA